MEAGNDLVRRAKRFAAEAHCGINQLRGYTNEPYIFHPAAVVALVRSVPHTDEMLAAAWLHDTVEDTPTTLLDIERVFGSTVSTMVGYLTDCGKHVGNRAERKAIDRVRLAAAPDCVKTIKLADLIDNTGTIVKYDPNFAKVYLAEKLKLLEVLGGGDQTLFAKAVMLAEINTHRLFGGQRI